MSYAVLGAIPSHMTVIPALEVKILKQLLFSVYMYRVFFIVFQELELNRCQRAIMTKLPVA